MLPVEFRKALEGTDELLVTSREDGREGTVHVWFVVTVAGDVYLFNYAFARRVGRWRKDPWVRLTDLPITSEAVLRGLGRLAT